MFIINQCSVINQNTDRSSVSAWNLTSLAVQLMGEERYVLYLADVGRTEILITTPVQLTPGREGEGKNRVLGAPNRPRSHCSIFEDI